MLHINKTNMMKTGLIVTFCCFLGLVSSAQNQGPDIQDTTRKEYTKIMIIPFETEMYLCGIQRNIAAESNKSHSQIVRFFRYGLSSQLQNKFLYLYSTTSLIHFNDSTKDLLKTYASIGYKFEPYQKELSAKEIEEGKKKKINAIFKKKKRVKLANGQLVSQKTTQPKFASLQLKNKAILAYLSNKYQTDLFVFITELDIQNNLSDQAALANNKYTRDLRAHYAIVDYEGKFISKGVVSTTFPNTVNSVNEITSVYFPKLADKLVQKLPKKIQLIEIKIDPLEKIKPQGM
ncbi:MAG: hypothetical protein ACJA0Q_001758 [Saprospiraceae bacterium]|jgi:hypothetical protein